MEISATAGSILYNVQPKGATMTFLTTSFFDWIVVISDYPVIACILWVHRGCWVLRVDIPSWVELRGIYKVGNYRSGLRSYQLTDR